MIYCSNSNQVFNKAVNIIENNNKSKNLLIKFFDLLGLSVKIAFDIDPDDKTDKSKAKINIKSKNNIKFSKVKLETSFLNFSGIGLGTNNKFFDIDNAKNSLHIKLEYLNYFLSIFKSSSIENFNKNVDIKVSGLDSCKTKNGIQLDYIKNNIKLKGIDNINLGSLLVNLDNNIKDIFISPYIQANFFNKKLSTFFYLYYYNFQTTHSWNISGSLIILKFIKLNAGYLFQSGSTISSGLDVYKLVELIFLDKIKDFKKLLQNLNVKIQFLIKNLEKYSLAFTIKLFQMEVSITINDVFKEKRTFKISISFEQNITKNVKNSLKKSEEKSLNIEKIEL